MSDAAAGPHQGNVDAAEASLSPDARYHFDEAKMQALVEAKPWMTEPKYFSGVAISPSAVMKMMMHCESGVQKGIAQGGNPVEVMGLCMGRIDPENPNTLVVTDAFPLPIEGFETRVIADDQAVVNHMIQLNECLERTRKEKFMGWYHSHPFDLADRSHCFLSQTDLSTQLQWQRAEDPHGNPFVAIVIDPLRSKAQQNPELKAFRAYPPEYSSPVTNECPDGSVIGGEQARLEHWGSCWNRYYELSVEYFMSQVSRATLEKLTSNYLWMRNFQSTTDDQQLTSKLDAVTGLSSGSGTATTATATSSARVMGGGRGAAAAAAVAASSAMMSSKQLNTASSKLSSIATHELTEANLTRTKETIFQ